MADWGLYTALRGQNNWQQRRQDKMTNLMIAEKREKEAKESLAASMKAEEDMNKYFDLMQNMDVLPEDQERIKEVERNSRSNIIKGIARNNGDLKKFLATGGISDMNEYKNSILQSEEVKQALMNKANLASYMEDAKKGNRYFKPVQVQVHRIDKDGNKIMVNESMNFDEQMALFRAGKINKINYNGSEQKVKLNPFMFAKQPKDPRNPYSKDNLVTASDIIFAAMEQGASEEYAKTIAKEYVSNGRAWYWGNKSEHERALVESQIGRNVATMSKLSQTENQSGGINDRYNQVVTGKGFDPKDAGVKKEWNNGKGAQSAVHYISSEDMNLVSNALGLDFNKLSQNDVMDNDGNFIAPSDLTNKNLLANATIYSPRTGKSFDMSNANYSVIGVGGPIHRINGESFIQAEIYTDENSLEANGIQKTQGVFDEWSDDFAGDVNPLLKDVGGTGNENYIMKAFIKLNDAPAIREQASKNAASAQWKEKSGVEGTGRGYGEVSSIGREYFEQ